MRYSCQREQIYRVLKERPESHLTGWEIAQIVRQELPRLSIGTAYRDLKVLERIGTVCKVHRPTDGTACFQIAKPVHAHYYCPVCMALEDIPNDQLDLAGFLRWESDCGVSCVIEKICETCRKEVQD